MRCTLEAYGVKVSENAENYRLTYSKNKKVMFLGHSVQ